MGWGSYTGADWAKLRESAKLDSSSGAQTIFKRKEMNPKFDPRFIGMREARDSEDHPDSTPVILGLDVTGSMGYLAEQIAKEGLNETMMKLFSTKPVNDPQVMFAAIGDVEDEAPLQVTQFESDIRIAEQLLELWLELCGADSPEDYELLWYFAAKHTSTDCFEKRGKKGFLFTIGDADIHKTLKSEHIKKIFNDDSRDMLTTELLHEVSKSYEVFHIHIHKDGYYDPRNLPKILRGRIITVHRSSISLLPELIVSTMLLCGGRPMDEVLENWSKNVRPVIKTALADLKINNKEGISF